MVVVVVLSARPATPGSRRHRSALALRIQVFVHELRDRQVFERQRHAQQSIARILQLEPILVVEEEMAVDVKSDRSDPSFQSHVPDAQVVALVVDLIGGWCIGRPAHPPEDPPPVVDAVRLRPVDRRGAAPLGVVHESAVELPAVQVQAPVEKLLVQVGAARVAGIVEPACAR